MHVLTELLIHCQIADDVFGLHWQVERVRDDDWWTHACVAGPYQ